MNLILSSNSAMFISKTTTVNYVRVWVAVEKQFGIVLNYLEQQGLEELYKEFSFLESAIKSKGQFENSVLGGRDMVEIFRGLLARI